MCEKQLVYLKRDDIDAATALQQFARLPLPHDSKPQSRVTLMYSPTTCRIGLIDDKGAPRDEDDSEIPIDDVYELRAFQAGFELRWLQESRRPAKTVIVGEYRPSNLKDWEEDSQPYQERLDRQYLLWGAAADSQPDSGWTRLEEARIVKLSVPINGIAARGCVTLHFHEYLADGDDDGNVVVIDQRLSHLAPFQP